VDGASNCSTPLAGLISFDSPFLSALFAAYLANTPDPTHSSLLSTLTLPGQAYLLFLAFSVRPGGPARLRYAPQARGAAAGGTCPRPAARAPHRPAPRAPWARAGSLYKLAGRAAEAPDPAPLFAPMPRTCWARLDASRDSTVWRTHEPGWARRVACRCGSRDTTTTSRGERGGLCSSAPAFPLQLWSLWSEVRGGGVVPALPALFVLLGTQRKQPTHISSTEDNRCRRLKFPNGLVVSWLRERIARVELYVALKHGADS
jgi:hypothetical protein